MPLAGFKPTIRATEQLQTHALDNVVTGIGHIRIWAIIYVIAFTLFAVFSNVKVVSASSGGK
jgi:hypothetical protein